MKGFCGTFRRSKKSLFIYGFLLFIFFSVEIGLVSFTNSYINELLAVNSALSLSKSIQNPNASVPIVVQNAAFLLLNGLSECVYTLCCPEGFRKNRTGSCTGLAFGKQICSQLQVLGVANFTNATTCHSTTYVFFWMDCVTFTLRSHSSLVSSVAFWLAVNVAPVIAWIVSIAIIQVRLY
jgi:hypothetical protein